MKSKKFLSEELKNMVFKTADFTGLNIKTPYFFYEERGKDIYLLGCDDKERNNQVEICKILMPKNDFCHVSPKLKDGQGIKIASFLL